MTTRLDDDGPESGPDDPLAVILRPSSPDYLGAPPGQYETIRRRATRRRLLRTATGAGLCCVAAVLIAVPLRHTASERPVVPTIPMAPPAPRTSPPTPSASPIPEPSPSESRPSVPGTLPPGTDSPRASPPGTPATDEATDPAAVSRAPSATPTSVPPAPSTVRPSTDRRTADGRR
ncbi:hypothetical protein BJ965_003668 [Streptomyces luteogriseus]|uniref:Uncharacterized protein n=1 Tax=Streptomyces luteogriseus TaxID=68233 RepID=A0A7W7DNC5_9ACTN|nr:hypothetical protein [Streptomyces luteogriseus]MBB4713786.1 hypothetical protein [Streptomyces luteogriseus]